MADRYPSIGDAALRLQETMVLYEGELIIVKAPHLDNVHMFAHRIVDGADIVVDPNSDALDITALPLGFMNLKNAGVYVTRRPERKQKQGFDYYHSVHHFPSGFPMHPRDIWNKDTFKCFRRTVRDEYPSFQDCLTTVGMSKAFSRGMAVRRAEKDSTTLLVNLCGVEDIGIVYDGGVLLSEKYKAADWLRKKLKDRGVDCAN